MFAAHGEPTAGEERSPEWTFSPRAGASQRTEEVAAFREALATALRVGHGAATVFDLVVTSGPSPRLTLGCHDARSARWVTRVLLPTFGRGAWSRSADPDPVHWQDTEWARRVRPWPDAFRDAGDGASALDSLAVAVRGVPPGYSVRWTFEGCPPSWRRPDLATATVTPAGAASFGTAGGRPVPFGVRRPIVESTTVPAFWKLGVTLRTRSLGGPPARVPEEVRATLECAVRSGRANGLRFTARRFRLPWSEETFPVSDEELLSILPSPRCATDPPRSTEMPSITALPVGRTGEGNVVGLVVEPTQGRHLAVLGETGMGKSSTLVALARRASRLAGVVLFDPLGETARDFLGGLTDSQRARLVLVSPLQPENAINALEGAARASGDPVRSDRRLTDLVHALRRVRAGQYPETPFWGPRIEEMVTRALAAAAELPGGTLTDAHTLLATGGRTRQLVTPEAREMVRELSDRIRDRPDDAEGARRLLFGLVRSPVLEQLLCSRSPSRRTSDLVTPGRILVVSGEASSVGETTSRYLLSVYLAIVWSELLSRPQNPKTFVVLDESQWFSHESLAEMLRLARRRNVHVILATQTVASLPESVAEAVWTNVSDFVAFRGSPDEARELSRVSRGLSVDELLSLPRGHAAVLLGKGRTLEWVRTTGRPETGPSVAPLGPPSGPRPGNAERTESDPEKSSPRVEDVLTWIRSRVEASQPGRPVTIRLSELRSDADPAGIAVRRAGAELGRAGAILSTGRADGTSYWVVDPARVPRKDAGAPPSEPPGRAEGPQPS